MLLSAVSVLVVAQWSSEIPEGLMNNPVFCFSVIGDVSAIITELNENKTKTVSGSWICFHQYASLKVSRCRDVEMSSLLLPERTLFVSGAKLLIEIL
jgi:hypothetical protein